MSTDRKARVDHKFLLAVAEQRLKLYKRRMFETGSDEDTYNFEKLRRNLRFFKHMVKENSAYPLDGLFQ